MTKEKRNKFIIVITLVLFGVLLNVIDYYFDYSKDITEEKSVENFFEKVEPKNKNITNKKNLKENNKNLIEYIAVLEIPKMKLKKGLVDPDSYSNNVNMNIQILKPYAMPNIKGSNLILASHSGSSRVAFFDDLNLLTKDDNIFIYYNNVRYSYKVIKKYEKKKDGTLIVSKKPKDTILTLTTCSKNSRDKQLIVVSVLSKSEKY